MFTNVKQSKLGNAWRDCPIVITRILEVVFQIVKYLKIVADFVWLELFKLVKVI